MSTRESARGSAATNVEVKVDASPPAGVSFIFRRILLDCFFAIARLGLVLCFQRPHASLSEQR